MTEYSYKELDADTKEVVLRKFVKDYKQEVAQDVVEMTIRYTDNEGWYYTSFQVYNDKNIVLTGKTTKKVLSHIPLFLRLSCGKYFTPYTFTYTLRGIFWTDYVEFPHENLKKKALDSAILSYLKGKFIAMEDEIASYLKGNDRDFYMRKLMEDVSAFGWTFTEDGKTIDHLKRRSV